MERRLLDYLPFFLRKYPQFRAAMESQQPEFEAAWDAAAAFQDDLFVMTAGERGLSRWERLLGILPKASDDFGTRRARILAALNRQLPYTLPQLRRVLTSLYGSGMASADVAENSYILRVDIPYTETWADTVDLIDGMSPQNLFTRCTAHLEDAHIKGYAAALPCCMTLSTTIHLPGVIGPKKVRTTAHLAGAVGTARMQAAVSLPGVIGPKEARGQTFAAGRVAHTYETINIKIGGIS